MSDVLIFKPNRSLVIELVNTLLLNCGRVLSSLNGKVLENQRILDRKQTGLQIRAPERYVTLVGSRLYFKYCQQLMSRNEKTTGKQFQ